MTFEVPHLCPLLIVVKLPSMPAGWDMHPTSIMPSNELTLCTAAGITLLYCVKCQHHYGPVWVRLWVCVREREWYGWRAAFLLPEHSEQEQDGEEIKERISGKEATGSHWGRQGDWQRRRSSLSALIPDCHYYELRWVARWWGTETTHAHTHTGSEEGRYLDELSLDLNG